MVEATWARFSIILHSFGDDAGKNLAETKAFGLLVNAGPLLQSLRQHTSHGMKSDRMLGSR